MALIVSKAISKGVQGLNNFGTNPFVLFKIDYEKDIFDSLMAFSGVYLFFDSML